MKINTVPIIIAIAICALLAYAFYAFCKTPGQEALLAIGGFICLFVPMATALAMRFEEKRTSANVAVLGWVFFLILLVSHIVFAFINFHTPVYIIVNGLLLLAFVGIAYSVGKARQ